MALTTITKTSGVVFILSDGAANPKSYFGLVGKYQFADDDTTFQIFIGTDIYTNIWQNLRVGTSIPTSVSQAKVLLNSIFGT